MSSLLKTAEDVMLDAEISRKGEIIYNLIKTMSCHRNLEHRNDG